MNPNPPGKPITVPPSDTDACPPSRAGIPPNRCAPSKRGAQHTLAKVCFALGVQT